MSGSGVKVGETRALTVPVTPFGDPERLERILSFASLDQRRLFTSSACSPGVIRANQRFQRTPTIAASWRWLRSVNSKLPSSGTARAPDSVKRIDFCPGMIPDDV